MYWVNFRYIEGCMGENNGRKIHISLLMEGIFLEEFRYIEGWKKLLTM